MSASVAIFLFRLAASVFDGLLVHYARHAQPCRSDVGAGIPPCLTMGGCAGYHSAPSRNSIARKVGNARVGLAGPSEEALPKGLEVRCKGAWWCSPVPHGAWRQGVSCPVALVARFAVAR